MAVIVGYLVSVLMAVLFAMGMLPSYERAPMLRTRAEAYMFAPWSVCMGAAMTAVVFFARRRQTSVFLDILCIDQEDVILKTQALLSMGAFLKKSASLHVFWDETWVRRLWCVFELAAFQKSHSKEEISKNLIIRPTLLGPCSLAVFLGSLAMSIGFLCIPFDDFLAGYAFFALLGFSGSHLALKSFRRYFAFLDTTLGQLRDFSLDSALSHCCETGHISQNGGSFVCDREIIKLCVCRWFGSVEDFEDSVKSDVSAALSNQLGNSSFSYLWVLLTTSPMQWVMMDQVAARLQALDWYSAVAVAIVNLTFAMAIFPSVCRFAMLLASRARYPCKSCVADELKTFAVFAVCVPFTMVPTLMPLGTQQRLHFKRAHWHAPDLGGRQRSNYHGVTVMRSEAPVAM